MSKKGLRVEEIVVQAVVTEYDDLDRPIRRIVTDPASYFRATTRDIWADMDAKLAETKRRHEEDLKAQVRAANINTKPVKSVKKNKKK